MNSCNATRRLPLSKAQIRAAGHPDLQGLCLALADMVGVELRLLLKRAEGWLPSRRVAVHISSWLSAKVR